MVSRPIDEAAAVASEADLDMSRSGAAEGNLLAGTSSSLWVWMLPSFTSAAPRGVANRDALDLVEELAAALRVDAASGGRGCGEWWRTSGHWARVLTVLALRVGTGVGASSG